jgi:hypothetical protein
MPETSPQDQLLTYEEAAKRLGVHHSTVKQLVYRDVLHPIVVSGSPFKYLTCIEIDWYGRRRHGAKDEPNPYTEALQRDLAEAGLALLQPTLEEARPAALPSQFTGVALLLVVVLLLLSLMAHKTPDPKHLEELRTAPEMQPVRRAILKLAGEITA